jgi:hypothetical protein
VQWEEQGVFSSSKMRHDSVGADAMSEKQTFRSEVNGLQPLSGHRSSVVQDEVRSSEKDFETLQLGAFATAGLLKAPVGLTAESGFKPTEP